MATCLIIRRGPEYLVRRSRIFATGLDPVWSLSCYDASRTRSISRARKIADEVGGVVMLFNPLVGQLRRLKP